MAQTVSVQSFRDEFPMAGEWAFTRANGKAICEASLSRGKTASGAMALKLKPGCDDAIAAFAPTSWQMDRGQLVLYAKAGDAWRFEEDDSGAWQRIPRSRDPLQLKRR